MPAHDWSKVNAGIFHHFHQAWIGQLCIALNQGLLPSAYYGLIEQRAGRVEPDILTLHSNVSRDEQAIDEGEANTNGGVAMLVDAPPEVDIIERADEAWYALKQSGIVVREVHNDRVVALLEIVSQGNKSSEFALERFVEKVATALMEEINVVVIDLHPPGKWDPGGIHHAIWDTVGQQGYEVSPNKPLTLASYTGMPEMTAYLKPLAVGQTLSRLPLFLDSERYVRLPLEETYQATYAGVPQLWRRRIEK